jgi:hypothetical protein
MEKPYNAGQMAGNNKFPEKIPQEIRLHFSLPGCAAGSSLCQ